MKSLFFIGRHGETILNESGLYRGWSDGPDAQLNEDGRLSAHAQGAFLASLGLNFKTIICSPLGRSKMTAAIVAGYVHVENLTLDDRLMPLNVGDLAGTPKAQNPIQKYLHNKTLNFPGGESVNHFEMRQTDFGDWLLGHIATLGEDEETFVEAHVSNTMYWWNLQGNRHNEEYLDEKTDLILPGGVSVVTDHACIPIFRTNEENSAEGGDLPTTIDATAIKGEPGTGYEDGKKGLFNCANCKYFDGKDSSCGQEDMLKKSKQPMNKRGRREVSAIGCCEYVDRVGKKGQLAHGNWFPEEELK
jgi:hypothetical protein